MKRYYTEYVRHCLRFFIKTLDEGHTPRFKTPVDKSNWLCCHTVISALDPQTIETVKTLYRSGDTLADKIYHISYTEGISQDYLWSLVNEIERKIAKKRGLL